MDDHERTNARVLGGFLVLIGLSVTGATVAAGPSRFFSFVRDLIVPVASGLAAIGVLAILTARTRPLTSSRAALVPVAVVVGQVAMLAHDRWLTAFGPGWSEYTGAHLAMAGFAFAIPLGSALRRRELRPALGALGAVVLVSGLSLGRFPAPSGAVTAMAGTVLIFGTPPLVTGYLFTASESGESGPDADDRTTATGHRG